MKRYVNPVRKFTKTEAAWLAAAIDGEGSIGLYTYVGDGRRSVIQMGNTSKPFVNEFRRIIGCGSQVLRHNMGKDHKGRKPMHYYNLKGSKRCKAVLLQVMPFLIIKKTKAKNIIREIDTSPFGRWAKRSHV